MWRRSHVRVDIAASWRLAREQFAALVAERDALRVDLAVVRAQRDETLSLLRELQAIVQARWAAEERLAGLYRERTLERARKAERDPAQLLH
jgi:hypothetical protein